MKYNIDKELRSIAKYSGSVVVNIYPILNMLFGLNKCKSDDNVTVSEYSTPGYNCTKLNTLVIEPKHSTGKYPCVILFHGGGLVLRASKAHYEIAKIYAHMAKCKVVFADYHLLPKYTFPIAIEDCYKTYEWVLENADYLNIDSDKIIVAGDSAGGNIAVAVAMMFQKRKKSVPCGAMLIYPVLDRRMITQSMKLYTDTPIWDAKCNALFWKMYLKDYKTNDIKYASPMEADSLSFFPKTYIEVAEFDCLRDEGIAFVERLRAEGVDTEFHEVKGACHGYESLYNSSIVKNVIQKRITWIQSTLYNSGN